MSSITLTQIHKAMAAVETVLRYAEQRISKGTCSPARLQKPVGGEAHIVAPQVWHAGSIEIRYQESVVGG